MTAKRKPKEAFCRRCKKPYLRLHHGPRYCSDDCKEKWKEDLPPVPTIDTPEGPIKLQSEAKVRWVELEALPDNFTIEELSFLVRHSFRKNPRLCADCPFCGEASRFFARKFGPRTTGQLQMACMACGFERIEYEQTC